MPTITEVKVSGYGFHGYAGLFWHSKKFWLNDKEVKQVHNNGSLSLLLYGNSKKSIKQLRKLAYPCQIIIYKQPTPF